MFKDILLPVDLEHESSWQKSLPAALALIDAFDSRLHVVTAVPVLGFNYVSQFFPENYEEQALAAANEHLHDFVRTHVPDYVSVQHIVALGVPYHEILRVAREVNADLIIMASHRPEMSDYLLGSNANHIVRHAPMPVLIVRQ